MQASSPSDKDFGQEIILPNRKPTLPKVGRKHPGETSLLYRKGRAVKGMDGTTVGHGENIVRRRKTICGMRDKMALAGSAAKTKRFVISNARFDAQLDYVPETINLTPPAPRRATKRSRASHTPLASSLKG